MNLAIILVTASILALGIILRLAVTQSLQVRRRSRLAVSVQPIDLFPRTAQIECVSVWQRL